MNRYYKMLSGGGELVGLACSPVEDLSGERITYTEYCMMKCGIKIFINKESEEKIKGEAWWKNE